MSGTLAGIGVGSGVDFGKVYDQLRKAEEASVVARPDKQIGKLTTEQKDLTSLMTHVNTLKGSINSLKDGSLFLKRNVDVSGLGDGGATVSVNVSSGVNKANFSLNVLQLAKKDSYQSGIFNTKTSTLFNDEDMYIKDPQDPSNNKPFSEGKFKISIDDKTFTINVGANDTLETLVDKMVNTVSDQSLAGTNKEDDKTKLSDYLDIRALKVDSSDNYRLVVSSKETGLKNKISFGVVGDNADDVEFSQNILNKLGFGAQSGLSSDLQIQRMKKISEIENQMDDMIKNLPAGQTEDDVKKSQAYLDLQKEVENHKKELKDIQEQNPLTYIEGKINGIDNSLDDILKKYGISKDDKLSVDDIIAKISSDKNHDPKDIDTFKSLNETKNSLQKNLDEFKKLEDEHHISIATDAIVEYDGIKISRSTNNVNDILPGADIKLLKVGESNVNISSDTSEIKDGLKDFVKNYNTLVANLDAATAYNSETKTAGTFQGVNEITRIKSELAAMINKVSHNSKYSLTALGFEINKEGVLEFDSAKFDSIYEQDPKGVEEYFSGKTTYIPYENHAKSITEDNAATIVAKGDLKINGKDIIFNDDEVKALENNKDPNKLLDILKKAIDRAKIDGLLVTIDNKTNSISFKTDGSIGFEIDGNEDKLKALGLEKVSTDSKSNRTDGIFTEFKKLIDSYVGSEGSLTKYNSSLGEETKKLQKEREKALKELDLKYSTMATRFNLYDQMITKMKTQESTINSMIQAQFANK